jgi:hypothetical protein
MKTLIIHPDDRSTDFLRAVYAGIPNKKVLTGGMSIWEVDAEIQKADRVIMLGHGTPSGLLSVGQFKGGAYVVDAQSASLLEDKKECIYIWCYASDFVKRHQLKGFASGMFISEVSEADYCRVRNVNGRSVTQEQVDTQCEYFCEVVGKGINLSSKELYKFTVDAYGEMLDHCPIVRYNHSRLYFN